MEFLLVKPFLKLIESIANDDVSFNNSVLINKAKKNVQENY